MWVLFFFHYFLLQKLKHITKDRKMTREICTETHVRLTLRLIECQKIKSDQKFWVIFIKKYKVWYWCEWIFKQKHIVSIYYGNIPQINFNLLIYDAAEKDNNRRAFYIFESFAFIYFGCKIIIHTKGFSTIGTINFHCQKNFGHLEPYIFS